MIIQQTVQKMLLCGASALFLTMAAPAMAAVDEDAAVALTKKEKCTKCHATDKKKDGPSFKETAAKYKGKADAMDKLYKHLTTNPKIKVDGKEEEHSGVKSASDPDIKNLIAYILSR
jgi:cytochrome c